MFAIYVLPSLFSSLSPRLSLLFFKLIGICETISGQEFQLHLEATRATYACCKCKKVEGRRRGKGVEGGVVGIPLEFSHIYLKFATHMHKQMDGEGGGGCEDSAG